MHPIKYKIFGVLGFTVLLVIVSSSTSSAGLGSSIDDLIRVFARKYGDDLTRIGEKQTRGRIQELGVKYGDEALEILAKTGPQGVEYLSLYGDDFIRWFRLYGEDVFAMVARSGFRTRILPLVRRYGDDIMVMEMKAPGVSRTIVQGYGANAVACASKLTPRNLARLAQCGPPLLKTGKSDKFINLVAQFGNKVFATTEKIMQAMSKHPKVAGMTLTFAYILTHPELVELFVKEATNIPGDIARELIGVAADKPGTFPVKFLVLVGSLTLLMCLKIYWGHKRQIRQQRACT